MSWHLRSVTFAADLSVNDLTWEAFLTKVYAPSTEQALVSENCEFLIEEQRPRKSKVETKAGSVFPILPSCERCRMLILRSTFFALDETGLCLCGTIDRMQRLRHFTCASLQQKNFILDGGNQDK